ncbi:hypothetical protein C9374_008586 [Naegleria lovaniensis]|uniref:Calponin-homology (CH) domain-containing protein n=1 Tax=Naegleria lovaniensis TaxID=51637 RepID=A0AA88GEM7_NAELO|nr:uncharacterized protein C9374_008586 [Naegleria lovaniensis]KAG2377964.1 hypothetical protein C9374_008586 [Naegleria lovaniensis]
MSQAPRFQNPPTSPSSTTRVHAHQAHQLHDTSGSGGDGTIPSFDEEELQMLYTWVDEIPLSRPKKNIARDFSDGVLMAEVVKHFFPKLVDLHNYVSTSSSKQKGYNWQTLDQKVFQKIGFYVDPKEFDDMVKCKPFAAERMLKNFQIKVSQIQQRKLTQQQQQGSRASSGLGNHNNSRENSNTQQQTTSKTRRPASASSARSQRATQRDYGDDHMDVVSNQKGSSQQAPNKVKENHDNVQTPNNDSMYHNSNPLGKFSTEDIELVREKDAKIHELEETVKLLESKINKLQLLIRLKDSKIQALNNKIKN